MRPFFLCLKPSAREKETTTQPTPKANQQSQESKTRPRAEAKQGSRTRAGRKQDKRGKRKDKRTKSRANTPQAPKPPNSTRAQKPHSQRKDLNPYKYTSAPQKPLKTPLKSEIRAYLQATRQEQSNKADKKEGTRHQRTRANRWQVLKPRSPAHLWTSGHDERQPIRTLFQPFFYLGLKNMFTFRPFRSPKIPRKHQAPPKNHLLLPLFALIRCLFVLPE